MTREDAIVLIGGAYMDLADARQEEGLSELEQSLLDGALTRIETVLE